MQGKKVKISQAEVKHIADLARLQLSDEELAAAATDLSNILDHFSNIQAIDTEGVPTSDDVTGLANVMREDAATPEDLATHTELLEAAPEQQESHIKVKAVFKE